MASGIYKITCGGKWYFGQSAQLNRRKNDHHSYLMRNAHCNPILQNTYNKHQDFTFEVIMECPVAELDHYEQMILDVWYGEPECMNICKEVVGTRRGIPMPIEAKSKIAAANRGRKHSDETKAKLSNSLLGNTRSIGRARPEGAGTPAIPVEIDGIMYPSIREAARQLGCSTIKIDRIIKGAKS